ncbi:alpha/beta hydrolase [soil metagenome]
MQRIGVGDLEVAYLDEGPAEGPPVVMLHGFPDGPFTFDHLAGVLVGEGYRVIRPWLRGYPPTTVPDDRAVGVEQLVEDLHGLVAGLDLSDPVLVGHDWGAVIGWASAVRDDHPWMALVALAIPPAPVQARARRSPRQMLYRAGYMLPFQLPGAEHVLPRVVPRLYRRWSPGWTPPPAHMDQVLAMVGQVDAARAMLAYYRGIVPDVLTGRYPRDPRAVPEIPLRYLHGELDTCFPARAARRSRKALPDGSVRVIARCGHFLHLERPEEVAEDIARFLAALR